MAKKSSAERDRVDAKSKSTGKSEPTVSRARPLVPRRASTGKSAWRAASGRPDTKEARESRADRASAARELSESETDEHETPSEGVSAGEPSDGSASEIIGEVLDDEVTREERNEQIKELIRKIDLDEITAQMQAWLFSPPPDMRAALEQWAAARDIDID